MRDFKKQGKLMSRLESKKESEQVVIPIGKNKLKCKYLQDHYNHSIEEELDKEELYKYLQK
jgi:hypothetical protein